MEIGLTNPVKEQAEKMVLITMTKASQAGWVKLRSIMGNQSKKQECNVKHGAWKILQIICNAGV